MKKIKLKDLAVKSFVTSVKKTQKQTIIGGETGLGFCLDTPTRECISYACPSADVFMTICVEVTDTDQGVFGGCYTLTDKISMLACSDIIEFCGTGGGGTGQQSQVPYVCPTDVCP